MTFREVGLAPELLTATIFQSARTTSSDGYYWFVAANWHVENGFRFSMLELSPSATGNQRPISFHAIFCLGKNLLSRPCFFFFFLVLFLIIVRFSFASHSSAFPASTHHPHAHSILSYWLPPQVRIHAHASSLGPNDTFQKGTTGTLCFRRCTCRFFPNFFACCEAPSGL